MNEPIIETFEPVELETLADHVRVVGQDNDTGDIKLLVPQEHIALTLEVLEEAATR